MKKFLMIAAATAITQFAAAQVQFGVKGGLNITSFVGESSYNVESKAGLHVGGLARIAVTDAFRIQPEIVFSTQGARTEREIDGYKIRYATNFINVPVMVQYHFPQRFYAETGPQLGFLVSAKQKYDGDAHDFSDDAKKVDFSWGFGLGFHLLPELGINARYNLGISRLDEDGDSKLHQSVFQLGVLYLFNAK
ncbi:porin family protein [Flavihumibacter petaseus]|uniref:Outer membrane protein beta-barrel domain-containing protein n=1 Tax=Flavihumibacter petaseus NBRC 106054 TaxID=1220578 RepID=A0A0E9N3H3_9BACT|nr:porin family protein [Flavihumibacter petaseus]GAO44353.1 hypothetical protein FPE01S_03_03910 [Flavihumibacter petaseus NBRC 106054]